MPIHPIVVPKWGLEMSEGTIANWHLEEGAEAAKGAELVDIETDKIVNTLELSIGGTLKRRIGEVGAVLPVGALIAVMADADTPPAEIDAFIASFRPVDASFEPKSEATPPVAVATVVAPSAAPAPPIPEAPVQPQAAAPKIDAAELARRNEAAHASPTARRYATQAGIDLSTIAGTGRGGRISQEDVEKAAAAGLGNAGTPPAAEMPAALPAKDAAALAAANAERHATPYARRLADRLGIALSGLQGSGRHGRISEADVEAAAAAHGLALVAPDAPLNSGAKSGPAARKLASELGVDLAAVSPTGGRGSISKDDVRSHAASTAIAVAPLAKPAELAPSHATVFEDLPLSAMRKSIAQALVQSKQQIPHFYLAIDVAVDEFLALRHRLNARPAAAAKISVNDFILKATALALLEVPDANVHFLGDTIRRFARPNVAMAVAIPDGLITPVLQDTAALSVEAIARHAVRLAEAARARTLKREEMTGGTFTVSNLGMYGIRDFQAIIAPPQGAILAVGASRREAFENGEDLEFHSVLTVTLSCDHRAIDGAVGARFLAAFKRLVEDPYTLIL